MIHIQTKKVFEFLLPFLCQGHHMFDNQYYTTFQLITWRIIKHITRVHWCQTDGIFLLNCHLSLCAQSWTLQTFSRSKTSCEICFRGQKLSCLQHFSKQNANQFRLRGLQVQPSYSPKRLFRKISHQVGAFFICFTLCSRISSFRQLYAWWDEMTSVLHFNEKKVCFGMCTQLSFFTVDKSKHNSKIWKTFPLHVKIPSWKS